MVAEKVTQSEYLKELAKVLMENISQAKDFAVEQLPLLVQEIITYNRAYYTLVELVFLCLIVFCTYVVRKQFNKLEFDAYKDNGKDVFMYVICLVLDFVSMFGLMINLNKFVMVWFAPKLFILEYLKGYL